ncbi:hypothetical protein KI387_039105 [Taxus chinensis]|uniref:Uncharacterized protein n=1 Tax=Taxus chinensis TaxID=29808 RepID=A0AA38C7Q9_TAXCH|nr:hypothetical protein KI387_039105 [Taxus chinensis]
MAQFGSWQLKMSMLVFITAAIVLVILSQDVSGTEEKAADCTEGKVACGWNKVKSYSSSAFEKFSFPSGKKTGEVVKNAATQSYGVGKKAAEDTAEKIKHPFGSDPEL